MATAALAVIALLAAIAALAMIALLAAIAVLAVLRLVASSHAGPLSNESKRRARSLWVVLTSSWLILAPYCIAAAGTGGGDRARSGGCDLIRSHYGHKQAEAFVASGFGEFRGVTDAFEAFAKIAKARAPFIVNDLFGQRYVAEILWHAAGEPSRDGWWIDPKENREGVLEMAADKKGYTMWGLTPFARAQSEVQRALEPLVYADPILQRLLLTIDESRQFAR